MISALQIDFPHRQPKEDVETRIRQELAEFEKFYNRLVSCRVEVDIPERERRGSVSKVRIDLGVPSGDAAMPAKARGVEAGQDTEHLQVKAQRKDPAMAVHAAFNIARRQLKDFIGSTQKLP
jgi:ribosome-associated translation inhibitor RaiA